MADKRKFISTGHTCIKCEQTIPMEPQEHAIKFVSGTDHDNISTPPDNFTRVTTWQGTENCKIKGLENVNKKTPHLLIYCPRCWYIDEVMCVDFPDTQL